MDSERRYPAIQFLVLDGEEYAVIPMRMLVAMEDLEALRDELLAARALQNGDGEAIPAEVVHAIVEGMHPVRAWRECRALSRKELAHRSGLTEHLIEKIERGACQPGLMEVGRLATALEAPLDAFVEHLVEFYERDC